MQPSHQHSRINLSELKAQIVKKLGPEGSRQYFHYLSRLLSLKISKVEFNKLCFRILGRENIPLHNQFIRSILRNACSAKVPPPINEGGIVKPCVAVGNKEPLDDAYDQNGVHVSSNMASGQPGLSNGDVFPLSPRKTKTGFRDRRAGDCRSVLGPNGKTSFTFQQSTTMESSDFDNIKENGDLNPPNVNGAVKHHQGFMLQTDDERQAFSQGTTKLSVIKRSLENSVSLLNKKDKSRDDGKTMCARSQLQAPLGVPFCTVSVGGAHKPLHLATSSRCVSSSSFGALLDSVTLRERMEHIASEQGLDGVTTDCANLLNNGLDSYLKGLIRSCLQLVGARSGHEPTTNNTKKQQTSMKLVNGLTPGYHLQMNGGRSSEAVHENASGSLVSLQDFRVAMELNPRQLGEDWPLLLEKVTHAVEE